MPNTKSSIMTGSGRYFDPLNPTASDVHLPDIARGLRRGVTRFNGQLLDPAACPHPQSGVSHSMRAGRLVFWWLRTRDLVKPEHALTVVGLVLAGLIHDSPEGYVGDDLGPIKTPDRKAMEHAILVAIAESLLGPEHGAAICEYVGNHAAVHWADQIALRQEALLYQPGATDWALGRPGLDAASVHERRHWDEAELDRAQMRFDIADTLHLFHPREGEDWAATVMALVTMHREVARDDSDTEESAFHLRRLSVLCR